MNNPTVKVGAKNYGLSPLTISEFKRATALAAKFQQLDQAAREQAASEFTETLLGLLLGSLKRNDPSITLTEIENNWTHAEFAAAWSQLMELSTAPPISAPAIPRAIN